ncbi:hypothetical protein B0H17DRAFT_1127620 [Mycena rosella]|uniref:Uncharacterized protein n=1 Tax=Mycena rosella TaxID=1033263 RepID=A0AAD7E1I9_MYCRO|nr:hypothetical protein B0H17DRAFT_1127620 [Mycena rosella]
MAGTVLQNAEKEFGDPSFKLPYDFWAQKKRRYTIWGFLIELLADRYPLTQVSSTETHSQIAIVMERQNGAACHWDRIAEIRTEINHTELPNIAGLTVDDLRTSQSDVRENRQARNELETTKCLSIETRCDGAIAKAQYWLQQKYAKLRVRCDKVPVTNLGTSREDRQSRCPVLPRLTHIAPILFCIAPPISGVHAYLTSNIRTFAITGGHAFFVRHNSRRQ